VSLSYFVLCFNCKFDLNLLTFLIDYEFDVTLRQRLANQVLGNLCRLHYSGMVTLLDTGKREIATT
jgi:hypothetical protein